MQFTDVLGHDALKKQLYYGLQTGRIAHAQLFSGPEGTGTLSMALAYARQVLLLGIEPDSEKWRSCQVKMDQLAHPDLHFIFPVVGGEGASSKSKSADYLTEWREFIKKTPYGNCFDWLQSIQAGNKQGNIKLEDAHEIIRKVSLKSYEGGYKVVIIWMAELMNIAAANTILKLLEEPPQKTLFLLVVNQEDDLLNTIYSRCQTIRFQPLPEAVIGQALQQFHFLDTSSAALLAHQAQGNYNRALHLLLHHDDALPFEKWFVDWLRTAYKAKGNPGVVRELIVWSEHIASLGRETQKQFLAFCLQLFRQALLTNYQVHDLVYFESEEANFSLDKLAPFVNSANIFEFFQELSEAHYHVERNGNPKIIFSDLSLKMTRLIHKKELS
ncbi:MAG: DNA polymerase III subunit delta' [Flavobacterium sp. BFFFF2]|nr:MAG: DNA polymerase III subunit delta' [Flavobacterium sp. BFFFF2]